MGRFRLLPSPKCLVALQRGRKQQPAHQGQRLSALDEVAIMRSSKPEDHLAFAATRVKHTAHASTGSPSATHSTARAPLQQHLHFLHATPRHTLHHKLRPAPYRPGDHVHTARCSGQSMARERHTPEHAAHSPTRRILRRNGAEGQQRFLTTALAAWRRSLRKKTRFSLDELERTLEFRAKFSTRQQISVGA
jgi:hypothetical protein